MKKVLLLSYFILWTLVLEAQIIFNDSTIFSLGSSASFTSGGDANFKGSLINNGTIVSYQNLNFYENRNVGSLKFVGAGDQEIIGDTLFVTDLEINKTGNVKVLTAQVFVSGNLNVISGVIQTDDIDDLIVTGQSSEEGDGYVEGKLVGLSSGSPVSFPMGVNGFRNSLTFSNTQAGTRLIVNCLVPDPAELLPSDEMVGIADEVEWQVRAADGNTQAVVTANFSGLDFINFSNGESIRADGYAPALVIIQKKDTIYSILNSSEATPDAASTETSGRVVSTTAIDLDTTITRINVAWLPFKDKAVVYIPNVFSPEGIYEENRVFRPFFAGGEVTGVTMAVYNAYNSEVYRYSESGADLDLSLMGWDGKLKGGQPAEEGVYYYKIFVKSPGLEVEKEEVGTVLLVK